MDKNTAGVLVKAQSRGQSANVAYVAITAQIKAFKGMPRARFDALWRETAAARPTGNYSREYPRHAQWLTNLGHRPAGFKAARQPVAVAPTRAAVAPARTVAAPARRPMGGLTAADREAIAHAREHAAKIRAAAESQRVRNWLLTGTY